MVPIPSVQVVPIHLCELFVCFGLFECCANPEKGACGLCCTPCLHGQDMNNIGENYCLSAITTCCLLPCDRGTVRKAYSIEGGFCGDCVISLCCAYCVIVQISNEVTFRTIYSPAHQEMHDDEKMAPLVVDNIPHGGGVPPPVPSRSEYAQRRQSAASPRADDEKKSES